MCHLALFMIALSLLGCTEGEAEPTQTISVVVRTVAFIPPRSVVPVADVETCLVEPAGHACVASDAAGEAFFEGVPVGERARARAVADGFATSFRDFDVPSRDAELRLTLLVEAGLDDFADTLSIPWPAPERGIIAVETQLVSDIVATIEPSAGEGPFYLAETGFVDPSLEATSSLGVGIFTGLPPDDYELTLAGCSGIEDGVVGSAPNAARSSAEPNGVSFVTAICP